MTNLENGNSLGNVSESDVLLTQEAHSLHLFQEPTEEHRVKGTPFYLDDGRLYFPPGVSPDTISVPRFTSERLMKEKLRFSAWTVVFWGEAGSGKSTVVPHFQSITGMEEIHLDEQILTDS